MDGAFFSLAGFLRAARPEPDGAGMDPPQRSDYHVPPSTETPDRC